MFWIITGVIVVVVALVAWWASGRARTPDTRGANLDQQLRADQEQAGPPVRHFPNSSGI